MRAKPALLKLASVVTTSCFPGIGCFNALFTSITQCFVHWMKGWFFQFWCGFDSDFCIQKFVEWVELFSHPGYKISVITYEPQIALKSLLDLGKLNLLRKFWIFWGCGNTPSAEMALPRNSTCLAPKWHFSIVNFNPAGRMHLRTARIFRVRSVSLMAAIPISSTYWAHWSALTTGSKYSRVKFEKADTDLLRPCASLL